jgi:hypothetical protein
MELIEKTARILEHMLDEARTAATDAVDKTQKLYDAFHPHDAAYMQAWEMAKYWLGREDGFRKVARIRRTATRDQRIEAFKDLVTRPYGDIKRFLTAYRDEVRKIASAHLSRMLEGTESAYEWENYRYYHGYLSALYEIAFVLRVTL